MPEQDSQQDYLMLHVNCYSNRNKQHLRAQVKSVGRGKDHNNRNHQMNVQVKGDGRRKDGGKTAKTR